MPQSHLQYLDGAGSIEKVWDYPASPDQFVFKGDKPSIIAFISPTREVDDYSRMLETTLVDVAVEYKDRVDFFVVNYEKEPKAFRTMQNLLQAQGFPLSAIADPQNRNNCKYLGGAKPYDVICAHLDSLLGKTKPIR